MGTKLPFGGFPYWQARAGLSARPHAQRATFALAGVSVLDIRILERRRSQKHQSSACTAQSGRQKAAYVSEHGRELVPGNKVKPRECVVQNLGYFSTQN